MRRAITTLVLLAGLAPSAGLAHAQGNPAPLKQPAKSTGAAQTPAPNQPPNPSSSVPATQRIVTITVPEPGEKYVRILPSPDSKQPEQLPQAFSDTKTTITFDPAIAGKSPKVAVDDAKTGNTAIVPIPAGDKPIDPHRADFDHVQLEEVLEL